MSETKGKLFKVLKIFNVLCKIVKVFLIIGVVGCLIAIAFGLTYGASTDYLVTGNYTFDVGVVRVAGITGLLTCAESLYFVCRIMDLINRTLETEKVFSLENADDTKDIAVKMLVIELVVAIIIGVLNALYKSKYNVELSISFTGPLLFYVLSLIIRLGYEEKEA